MTQLAVCDLVVRYGDVTAVDRISFTAAEGEFVSLLGPSGCGKTTTLRCIAGLESLHAGAIAIAGETIARPGLELPPERRGVNMVFQSYAVWPHMTVFDNVAYGLRSRNTARPEIERRVAEALRLSGLADYAARYGTELSGGQQQRVAVARAVVTEPRLLLFDEPLSNLDAGLRERMRFELLSLQRRLGRTSIYVTHDQQEAMVMSDRIILMNAGRIVQQGTPRDLYERPSSRFAAGFLGNANLLPGRITGESPDGSFTVQLDGSLVVQARPTVSEWRPPANGKALICIRPEHVEIAEGTGVFPATVSRIAYLGTALDCELQLGTLSLRATVSVRSNIAEGDTVTLRIDPACTVLVPE